MDEKRIVKVQSSIKVMSEVEKGIQPIVNTCLGEICKASEKIDHGEVGRLLTVCSQVSAYVSEFNVVAAHYRTLVES